MRPLAGIVVEYLVVGSCSALWLLILLVHLEWLPKSVPVALLAVLVPLLYVFGMLSDRLGRFLIENRKKDLEKKLHREYGHVSTQEIHSRLVVHLPALAEQLEARRTRDRISRGVLANVPFVTLVVAWAASEESLGNALFVTVVGALLYMATLSMWKRYQTLSSKFEIHCDRRLHERCVERCSIDDIVKCITDDEVRGEFVKVLESLKDRSVEIAPNRRAKRLWLKCTYDGEDIGYLQTRPKFFRCQYWNAKKREYIWPPAKCQSFKEWERECYPKFAECMEGEDECREEVRRQH